MHRGQHNASNPSLNEIALGNIYIKGRKEGSGNSVQVLNDSSNSASSINREDVDDRSGIELYTKTVDNVPNGTKVIRGTSPHGLCLSR